MSCEVTESPRVEDLHPIVELKKIIVVGKVVAHHDLVQPKVLRIGRDGPEHAKETKDGLKKCSHVGLT
jgi:hypothetical protein